MASAKKKVKRGTLLPGPRLFSDSAEGRLWRELLDQRRHKKKEVLKKLSAKDPKGRLAKFKQHGEYPRPKQKYRWITHDNDRLLCIEISEIGKSPSN
jgi:hypothetical protein